jgi:hypothetical protein
MTARPLVEVGDRIEVGSGGYLVGVPGNYELRRGAFIGDVVTIPNGFTPVKGNWIALVATDARDLRDIPLVVQDHYLPGFVPRESGLPDMADPRW